MKGVYFVVDEKNERIAVQIELTQLCQHRNKLIDFLDTVVAEYRKNDEDVSWDDAKRELNNAGKI